jgi:hypothetical protein
MNTNDMFPITIGKKGVDPYFMKYNNGMEIPWPTEEDIESWIKDSGAEYSEEEIKELKSTTK